MTQKKKTDQKKVIISAAVMLADKTGWHDLTLATIARKAKVSSKSVEQLFPDIWAVLHVVLANLDKDTIKTAKKNLCDIWRDDLFEILMTRFELMEEHRGCFSSLTESFMKAPQTAPAFLSPFAKTMQGMLTLAKAPDNPTAVLTFGITYLTLVETWKNDETPDLSRTMAAVDKRLDLFERIQRYLSCPVSSSAS